MRDWWYEVVETKYGPNPELIEIAMKIDGLVLAVQQKNEGIDSLKDTLKEYANKVIDNITPDTSQSSSTHIVNLPFYQPGNPGLDYDPALGEGCDVTTTFAGTGTIMPDRSFDEASIGEGCSVISSAGTVAPKKFFSGEGETQ